MKVNTHNHWDPLEEVIVGHAHHSRVSMDISTRSFSYAPYSIKEIEHMEGVLILVGLLKKPMKTLMD